MKILRAVMPRSRVITQIIVVNFGVKVTVYLIWILKF